ncbi:MAG: preprotein translocase subunit SecA [Phycisphaerales bacterium]|nr:preprotein translocase subunit SecA [Phycisphaerales bacterium]
MAKQDIPIIGPILNRIIGSRNDRFVKRYLQRVSDINAMEPKYRAMTDAELRSQVKVLRERLDKGAKAFDLMTDAFAVAREGMDRGVGIRKIFDPERKFDPSTLRPEVRALYDQTKAQMDATPPCEPTGPFLGGESMIPGWQQVDIPNAIYDNVRELFPESRPPFRARPFDVQLIGAMVLSEGKISEMKTGEGKTIVAPLATFLACVERLKVHVVTVNDYLVQRDRDWTFPFFRALGLTVGAIHPQHQQPEDMKRQMYLCDVVYGTTAEFGFDYLRDNMKRSVEQQVQRRRDFAIVDEVDSVLIDEARTPLIISGQAHEYRPRYELADMLAKHLHAKQRPWQQCDDEINNIKKLIKGLEGDIRNARDKAKVPALQDRLKIAREKLPVLEGQRAKHTQYFEVQMERKTVHLSHEGVEEAQKVAKIGSFYVGENMDVPHLLEQAVRAHVVYQKDKDYIVAPSENPQTGRVEPSIVIVDVSTGRPMVGRQWSDGLHQAMECKENVPIKQETQTVASITVQNFFKMYKRLAGMTGTADTEAQEFHDIYKLDVVTIPTNKTVTRRDFDDIIFLTEQDKWDRIVDEIKNFHDMGRPILVGTTSVEKSELLSEMLTKKYGIKHEVLNAKPENIEREAHIVENAGQIGSVMIATNMAGRGTDIKLGKVTREALLDHWLRRSICPREVTIDSSEQQLREGIYRKMAPTELGVPKRELESVKFEELELRLLRHWTTQNTWLGEKEIARATADKLRAELDRNGRFSLHRLRWFKSVEDLGGLHVIGTERHESRRIDNQLRGRSGRQGDNGSSRFFISLQDDLMKYFGGEGVGRMLGRFGMKEGDSIENPMLSKSVERAQRKVEEINFQRRKQILEYDEVMEYQRRGFYGLRQRVLEGRDLRSLFFEYIAQTTGGTNEDFLDRAYATRCIADYAKNQAECTLVPNRLKGLSPREVEEYIRNTAREEWRDNASITLGEYMSRELPEGVDADGTPEGGEHLDADGLSKWVNDRFGKEIAASELRALAKQGRRPLLDRIGHAIDDKVDAIDLSGVSRFLEDDHGVRELTRWAENKFDIKLTPQEVKAAAIDGTENVTKLVLEKARKLYQKRETEFPVDYLLENMQAQRAQDPQAALATFLKSVRQRFGIEWQPQQLFTKHPMDIRKELIDASAKSLAENRVDRIYREAKDKSSFDELSKYFKESLDADVPESLRYLEGQERDDAVRSRVEAVTRGELIFFERSIMLGVLDPMWQDHLYAMDQLRDGISFRVYSQQDPRIEYKREGSRLYNDMMDQMRDRVTDYIFKVSIKPPAPQPAPAAAMGGAMRSGIRPMSATPTPTAPKTYTQTIALPGAATTPAGESPYYTPPSRPANPPQDSPGQAAAAPPTAPPAENGDGGIEGNGSRQS